ncbi:MAG: hypothetical protein AMXMBFR20_15570 [Planctomycetia bacterium]
MPLSLPLLVPRISRANDAYNALSLDQLAILTYAANAAANFHDLSLPANLPPISKQNCPKRDYLPSVRISTPVVVTATVCSK